MHVHTVHLICIIIIQVHKIISVFHFNVKSEIKNKIVSKY